MVVAKVIISAGRLSPFFFSRQVARSFFFFSPFFFLFASHEKSARENGRNNIFAEAPYFLREKEVFVKLSSRKSMTSRFSPQKSHFFCALKHFFREKSWFSREKSVPTTEKASRKASTTQRATAERPTRAKSIFFPKKIMLSRKWWDALLRS